MTKLLCNVYKSLRKEETYLYVSLKDDLSEVPDALMDTFGTPQLVTKLLLTPERKLALVTAQKVMDSIEEKGFYLQLPPPKENMGTGLDLFCKKDKDE
jgi:uncharacterized protein YcgL (UPF0745 family)